MATRTRCTDCGIRPIDPSVLGISLCEPCREYAESENQHSDESHGSNSAAPELTADCPVCHPELDPRDRPQPKATRRAKVDRPCRCSDGCTGLTRNLFAPGHDARLVSLLVRDVVQGRRTPENALAKAADVGAGPGLLAKLGAALERAR